MIEQETIVDYVRTSVAEVFSTMLGLDVADEPAYSDANAPTISDGVLAFVGMAGSWTGTGAICCSATLACRICSKLLMSEAHFVNEEVLDAVGEVANMIIGNFKTMLEERLGPMGLSIPTVVYGRNFTSRSLGTNQWIVLPFKCEGETITIRCCLAPARQPIPVRAGYAHTSTLLA